MSSTYIATNKATSTLYSDVVAGATSITVVDGSAFPEPTGGDYTLITLQNTAGKREIVCIVGRSGNALTVGIPGSSAGNSAGRNYETFYGSLDTNWTTGDIVSCRPTAELMEKAGNAIQPDDTQTMTNKTLVSPVITTPAISDAAFTGTNTAPTAAPGTSTTALATTAFVASAISVAVLAALPAGLIMMWSGTIATIPTGWALCDGNGGRPNLIDKFIIGASSDDAGVAKTNVTTALTQSGGSKDAVNISHTHTASVNDPEHVHSFDKTSGSSNGTGFAAGSGSSMGTLTAGVHSAKTEITVGISTDGTSGTNLNLPPYYALAFIIRV